MRRIPFAIFLVALFVRLVVVQLWKIPQIIYIPIELLLLTTALYFERDRLSQFFLRFDRIKGDIVWGLVLGLLFCIVESLYLSLNKGQSRDFRIDTLLLVPVGVALAGWRAGVYEELLFRSLAMGYFVQFSRRKFVAVLGQGFLFWIAHIRYFNADGDWGVSSLIFGLALGVLTIYRGSVIPAMIIHAIGNSYGGATLEPLEYLGKALRSWL